VKFLRHLGAATLVVGLVVLAGLAWNHFWPGALPGVRTGFGEALPPGAHIPPGVRLAGPAPGHGHVVRITGLARKGKGQVRVIANRPGAALLPLLFEKVNLEVLWRTAKIEAEIIVAVVVIGVTGRRIRRARRARRLAAAAGQQS